MLLQSEQGGERGVEDAHTYFLMMWQMDLLCTVQHLDKYQRRRASVIRAFFRASLSDVCGSPAPL